MSMNLADLYGVPSRQTEDAPTDQAPGPNPGAVAQPSRTLGSSSGNSAAMSWVGFVGLLVLLRIAIELGGRVE